jgi:hypothetical protein
MTIKGPGPLYIRIVVILDLSILGKVAEFLVIPWMKITRSSPYSLATLIICIQGFLNLLDWLNNYSSSLFSIIAIAFQFGIWFTISRKYHNYWKEGNPRVFLPHTITTSIVRGAIVMGFLLGLFFGLISTNFGHPADPLAIINLCLGILVLYVLCLTTRKGKSEEARNICSTS